MFSFSSMNTPLRILVVHSTPFIARSVIRDLKKIGTQMSEPYKATSAEEALMAIETVQPDIVFMGMDLPHDDALRLLQEYPPHRRNFAIILMDGLYTSLLERQKYIQTMLAHQAIGYLMVGVFDNQILAASIEQARHTLQVQILGEQQHAILECVMNGVLQDVRALDRQSEEWKAMVKEFVGVPVLGVPARTSLTPELPPLMLPVQIELQSQGVSHKPRRNNTHASLRSTSRKKAKAVAWSQVVRLQAQENYFEVWYFNESGVVKTELLRKEEIPIESMPRCMCKVHKSHYVNVYQISSVRLESLLMNDGSCVPLSKLQQERLRGILRELSSHFAALDTLRDVLRRGD
jgi:DNA-binding LytR/AlgR family response regulator